jgi:hypothetical protein
MSTAMQSLKKEVLTNVNLQGYGLQYASLKTKLKQKLGLFTTQDTQSESIERIHIMLKLVIACAHPF